MFIDYTYPLVVQCVSLIVPFLHELHRCILQSAVDNQHSIVEYTVIPLALTSYSGSI